MEKEVWKGIPGFEGFYQCSNLGRVRSLDRFSDKSNQLRKGKVLSLFKNPRGYMQVHLSVNNKGYSKRVHRLVALAFLPNENNFPEVNHLDTDKTNNCLSNLEWSSREGNIKHAQEHDLFERRKGSIHPLSKLTERQVLMIRIECDKRVDNLPSYGEIGNKFNVSATTVSNLHKRKSWKHC